MSMNIEATFYDANGRSLHSLTLMQVNTKNSIRIMESSNPFAAYSEYAMNYAIDHPDPTLRAWMQKEIDGLAKIIEKYADYELRWELI